MPALAALFSFGEILIFGLMALGWLERREPAGHVVEAAALAGIVATIFDIFVLKPR